MAVDDPKTLVSTDWLASRLKDPDIRVIDASWYLPAMNRDGKEEYKTSHIPGARFFDIDEISDLRSELPHMAPPVEKFMSRMRAMGIGDGHQPSLPVVGAELDPALVGHPRHPPGLGDTGVITAVLNYIVAATIDELGDGTTVRLAFTT